MTLRHAFQALKPSGAEYDFCSMVSKMNGRCFADPTTRSGDDDCFVRDPRHEFVFRRFWFPVLFYALFSKRMTASTRVSSLHRPPLGLGRRSGRAGASIRI